MKGDIDQTNAPGARQKSNRGQIRLNMVTFVIQRHWSSAGNKPRSLDQTEGKHEPGRG